MRRAISVGRETRSKSKTRKRSVSPDSNGVDQKCEKRPTEKSTSHRRMSRRDSYEETLTHKTVENRKSGRSMSSRKITEKEDESTASEGDDFVGDTDKKDESSGKHDIRSKLMSRRKSKRIVEKAELKMNDRDDLVENTQCTNKSTAGDTEDFERSGLKENESSRKENMYSKFVSSRKSRKIVEKVDETTTSNRKDLVENIDQNTTGEQEVVVESTNKEDEIYREDNRSKKSVSRRKSSKIKEKERKSTGDRKGVVENIDKIDKCQPNEKVAKKEASRKCRRLASQERNFETEEIDHELLCSADNPMSGTELDVNEPHGNMKQRKADYKTTEKSSTKDFGTERIIHEEKRSKRKSRRATKALFIADKIDEIMKGTGSDPFMSADKEQYK